MLESKGDMLIFSHDDIDIFSPEFPERLQRHLSTYDLVGLAGTSRLIGPDWGLAGPPYCFGQICQPHATDKIAVSIICAPRPVVGNIQAIDGLFFAARRSVLPRIAFDSATFDGFHLYDLDFSYAAYRGGLKIAVANDICAFHASHGTFDEVWRHSAMKFQQKWFRDSPTVQRRSFHGTLVLVDDRAEALEVMSPEYWLDQPPESRH